MRIAGGLAAGAVVAGMMVAGTAAAPAARAATGAAPEKAAAPAGVRSRWAELANAATGANLWSRSSTLERPMGSITKVMTAYVVLNTPGVNLNRVITVPKGIVAYDAGGASTASSSCRRRVGATTPTSRLKAAQAARVSTPRSSSSAFSSPLSNISRMMSQPPTNSPLT